MVGHDAPGFAHFVEAIPGKPNLEADYWQAKYQQLLERVTRVTLGDRERLAELRDEIDWLLALCERFWGDCPCHEQQGLECENCRVFRDRVGCEYR